MKIGIMGGTFDPIHNAHLIIAQMAKEQYFLDRMIFMPGGNPPHKKGVTDKHIRFEMTDIAIETDFEISDFEVKREEYSYTLSTLKHLHEQYPSDEIFFIIGEDSLNDIYKWHKPQEILKLCTMLVFPRNSEKTLANKIHEVQKDMGGSIYAIEAPVFGISSTDIRNRIKEGKSVKHMLPDRVLEYINEKGLYR